MAEQARLQSQLQQLASAMQALALDLGQCTGRPFTSHGPITAIPTALRARADGVEATIVLETGWSATHTSSSPLHPEFSAEIAVQSRRDGILHLWGRVERSHLSDTGRTVTTDVTFDQQLASATDLDARAFVDQLGDLARAHLPTDLDQSELTHPVLADQAPSPSAHAPRTIRGPLPAVMPLRRGTRHG